MSSNGPIRRVTRAKAARLKAAAGALVGGQQIVSAGVQRCANQVIHTVRVESITVRNRFAIDDYAANSPEWERTRAATHHACIQMGTALAFDIVLACDTYPPALMTFDMRISVTPAAGATTATVCTRQNIQIQNGQVHVVLAMPQNLHAGVAVTKIKLDAFHLTGDATVALAPTPAVKLDLFTIFGAPIRNNVRESNLYAPPGEPAPPVDPVQRIAPFFSVNHLRQACTWASGTSALRFDGIVQTIIRSIPTITYGEGDDYDARNDGWNAWDNPAQRSADCSQLASFFADVMGTVGIRAVDLELKCDASYLGRTYRRAFRSGGETWPTHGILLVNYAVGGLYTYDTTFTEDPGPRRVCTLAEATTVGAGEYIPAWHEWWKFNADGAPSRQNVGAAISTQLNLQFDTAWWQGQMQAAALARFPDADRQ